LEKLESLNEIGFIPLVKRWWWLLALALVVGGVAGYLGSQRMAPTYQADVKLLVGPVSADYGTLRASGELGRTYAELASSRPLLQRAIDRTKVRTTPADLRLLVRATSNEITRVVLISVQHGDPATAARLSNTLGEELIRLTSRTQSEDEEILSEFESQAEIERLSPAAREAVIGAARRTVAQSPAGRLAVVDPAEPPTAPVAPNVSLITIFGAIAGLLIVGTLLLVKESSSQRTADERSLAELEQPVFLGAIGGARRGSGGLAVETRPDSPVAESYRSIAAKVGFLDGRPILRTLVVLGDGPSGGVVAANLAAVLAEAQHRVLLVDADYAKGGASALLGLEDQPGYGELLESSRNAELNGQVDALRISRADGFDVLPKGLVASTGALDVDRGQRVLARLQEDADLIIVSVPPIHRSPAALVWSQIADGTVLVVDEGRTPDERVTEAIRSLSGFSHANLVGTILGRSGRPSLTVRS
jgi:capsular polysaccharide biosynthesis protein/Mrp family chromosome partitioning ATPase